MSNPYSELGQIILGDINVYAGVEPSAHGTGSMFLNNRLIVKGTQDTLTSSDGALVVDGGIGVAKSLVVDGAFNLGGNATLGGTLGVAGNTTFGVNATVSILNVTNSTSPTTGSITTAGGIGVGGDAFIGGLIDIAGNSTVDGNSSVGGTLTVTSNTTLNGTLTVAGNIDSTGGTVSFSNTTNSTTPADGAVTIDGGLGVALNLNVGGNTTITGNISAGGIISMTNTDDSTLPTNGALTTAGGLGVAKSANIGGVLKVFDTTDSTAITNGALIVAGGAGIAKSLNVGEDLFLAASNVAYPTALGRGLYMRYSINGSEDASYIQSSVKSGTDDFQPLFIQSGVMTLAAYNVATEVNKMVLSSTGVAITNATASTSTTTGSITTTGGLGVAGNANMGGYITAVDTITVASASSAGMIVNYNTDTTNDDTGYFDIRRNNVVQASFVVNDATVGRPLEINGGSVTGGISLASGGGNVGIGQLPGTYKLEVDGDALIKDTTEATTTTAAALVVSGGLGIALNTRIGGNLFVQQASAVSTNGTDFNLAASADTITLRNAQGNISGELASTLTNFYFRTTDVTPAIALNIVKATGVVRVETTTDSVGADSGAFQVAGGASINENLYVGNDLTVGGNISSGGGSVTFSSTIDSTSITTGAIVTPGGVGIGKTLTVGENIYAAAVDFSDVPTVNLLTVRGATFTDTVTAGTLASWASTLIGSATYAAASVATVTSAASLEIAGPVVAGTNVTITNSYAMRIDTGRFITLDTTVASSPTTGSIITAGGIGVAGASNFGGILTVSNATASTSGTSGALVVSGGVGIGAELYVTGITRLLDNTTSTTPSTGALVVTGGVGIGENLNVGGDSLFTGTVGIADITSITSAQASTDPTTGALVVTGGVGISGALNVNTASHFYSSLLVDGALTITNADQSTSTSTGCLILAGGLGVAKNVYIGELLRVVDATNSTSRTTGATVVTGGLGVGGDTYTTNLNVTDGTAVYTFGVSSSSLGGGVNNTTVGATGTRFNAYSSVPVAAYQTEYRAYALGTPSSTDQESLQFAYNGTTGGIIQPLTTGAGITRPLTIYTNTVFNTDGTLNQTNTTEVTAVTSGSAAVTVQGGVGIAKNLMVAGGNIIMPHATRSTLQLNATGDNIYISAFPGDANGDYQVYDTTGTSAIQSWFRGWTGNGSALPLNTFNGEFSLTSNKLGILIPDATPRQLLISRGTGFTSGVFQGAGRQGLFLETDQLTAGIPNVAGQLFGIGSYNVDSTLANTWVTVAGTTGITTITSNQGSTSSTTGALVVTGGVGIGQNLYVGGTGSFTGALSTASTLTVGGTLAFNDTTDSTDVGNGAVIILGGVSIAKNLNVGGNFEVDGTSVTNGNSTVVGQLFVTNATASTSPTTGAAVITGGVGIGGDLNVDGTTTLNGHTTIIGNLTVSGGSITSIATTTLTVSDNIILTNAAPSGSADGGYGIKRYQAANDTGVGDVVNPTVGAQYAWDDPVHSGTARTGSTTTMIVLDTTASAVDDYYNDSWIRIYGGTGVGQVRKIKDYNGTTKEAIIYDTADQSSITPTPTPVEGMDFTTVPDATSLYRIYDTQYTLMYYDEGDDEFVFGTTPVNPASQPFVDVRRTVKVHVGDLDIDRILTVDNIVEHTLDAGVTIEGVLIKDGTISGVTGINGTATDVTSTISLLDDNVDREDIPGTVGFGAYTIMVRAINNSGASAVFHCTARSGTAGQTIRTSSTPGTNNANLDLEWNANSPIRLRHRNNLSPSTGASLQYRVRVMPV